MPQELMPDAMDQYCGEILPGLLHDVCKLGRDRAEAIARDVLERAESFAALDRHAQDVLVAPSIEEVFAYEPADAPLPLKGAVAVVVRNSLLEEAHADGHVEDGGLEGITSTALGPLSHLLAARRRSPRPVVGADPFHGLSEMYPRAWACLEALTEVYADGGRIGYRAPLGPKPQLPTEDERLAESDATPTTGEQFFVLSAIEPKFDPHLISYMQHAQREPFTLYLPTLSRISRNTTKLSRTLEFFLAHGTTILTTNYMLRAEDAWIRRGDLIQPDNAGDFTRGLHDLSGLSGAHRKLVQHLAAGIEDGSAFPTTVR